MALPRPKPGRGPRLVRKKSQAALRRCLGVGKEHTFWSAHPGERICASCRAKIDAQLRGLSPMWTRPTRQPEEDDGS
jgi:hypothetical protein